MGCPKFFLRFLACPHIVRFRKDPLHRRCKSGEAILHDIVFRPVGQNLDCPVFAHGTGHEDERNIRAATLGFFEGQGAVVFGQVVVGEDQIVGAGLNLMNEILFGHHHFGSKGHFRPFQFKLNQLGIGGIISKMRIRRGSVIHRILRELR